MAEKTPWSAFTRRQALGFLGAASAASLIAFGRRSRAWAASCAVTPEETEGPYWVDEGLLRSDVTVDPSDGSVKPTAPKKSLSSSNISASMNGSPRPNASAPIW